jgi:4-amino-4-deoxy-L-arabinose transferase-like glycosyltransferase
MVIKAQQLINSKLQKIHPSYTIYFVMLMGIVLRLIGISRRQIWYDESFSLLYGNLRLAEMIRGTLGLDASGAVSDIHPLGYYFSLHLWMEIFGDSIFAARLFSVILGGATLYIGYLLSKLILPEKKVIIPVLILAISPFHIHYSQEIRMYSMMSFALVVATLALFKGMDDEKYIWWVIFAFSSAIAQYAQQLAAIYLLVLASIPLIRRDRRSILLTVISGILAIILYLPWLVHLPSQIASTNVYWIERPLLSRFLTLFIAYVSGLPVQNGWLLILFGIALIIIVFGAVGTVRLLKQEAGSAVKGLWFGYLAFLPPIILWGISQVRPAYIERALLASGVMFTLWIGYILAQTTTPIFEKYLLLGLLLVGAVSGYSVHLETDGFPYAAYKEIGNELAENLAGEELVIHSNKLSFLPMYYYFGSDLPQTFIADLEGGSADTFALPTQKVLGITESPSLEAAIAGRDSFYFLIFEAAINEMINYGLEEHPHLSWLNENYEIESVERSGDLWIYHYTK